MEIAAWREGTVTRNITIIIIITIECGWLNKQATANKPAEEPGRLAA
jgi:hypothetical protein